MKFYKAGTRIIRKDGHIYVKSERGTIKEARLIAMGKLNYPLTPMDRVFFVDGDWSNHDPDNIVVVRFQERRFRYLPDRAHIYIAKEVKEWKRKRIAA